MDEAHESTELNKWLIFREKPHDTDWTAINNLKLPLLLNFAQCKLRKKEYYEVIEHCSEVLKFEPGEFGTTSTRSPPCK